MRRTRDSQPVLPATVRGPPVRLRLGALRGPGGDQDGIASPTPATPGTPRRFVVPPGAARIELDFTGVSFSAPDQLRFRYRLHGLDPDWVPANEQRSATYTRLAPREYRFEVSAAGPDGDWNPASALVELVIRPYWWQTLAFRLATMLAVAGLVSLAAWAFHRRHLRRQLEAARRRQEQDYARTLAAANLALESRTRELEDALANVKVLTGLIPICASCKKIRDDQGFWNQVERYIQQRSDARFTHGICPDCAEKLYPELHDPPS